MFITSTLLRRLHLFSVLLVFEVLLLCLVKCFVVAVKLDIGVKVLENESCWKTKSGHFDRIF